MANAKYLTFVFGTTDLVNHVLTIPLAPTLRTITNVLRCYVKYNVTPAIEVQSLPIASRTQTEITVNMPIDISGTGHIATILYT